MTEWLDAWPNFNLLCTFVLIVLAVEQGLDKKDNFCKIKKLLMKKSIGIYKLKNTLEV